MGSRRLMFFLPVPSAVPRRRVFAAEGSWSFLDVKRPCCVWQERRGRGPLLEVVMGGIGYGRSLPPCKGGKERSFFFPLAGMGGLLGLDVLFFFPSSREE